MEKNNFPTLQQPSKIKLSCGYEKIITSSLRESIHDIMKQK